MPFPLNSWHSCPHQIFLATRVITLPYWPTIKTPILLTAKWTPTLPIRIASAHDSATSARQLYKHRYSVSPADRHKAILKGTAFRKPTAPVLITIAFSRIRWLPSFVLVQGGTTTMHITPITEQLLQLRSAFLALISTRRSPAELWALQSTVGFPIRCLAIRRACPGSDQRRILTLPI